MDIEEVLNIQLNKSEANILNDILSHVVSTTKLNEEEDNIINDLSISLDNWLHP